MVAHTHVMNNRIFCHNVKKWNDCDNKEISSLNFNSTGCDSVDT